MPDHIEITMSHEQEKTQRYDPYAAWRQVIRKAIAPKDAILWNPNTGNMRGHIRNLLVNPQSTEATDTYQKVANGIHAVFVQLHHMFDEQIVLIQIPPIASSKLAEILGDRQIRTEAAASARVRVKRGAERLPENSLGVEWLSTKDRIRMRHQYGIPPEIFDPEQPAFLVQERYNRFVAKERGKHFCEADVSGKYLVVQNEHLESRVIYPEEESIHSHFTAEIFGGWRRIHPKSGEVIILPSGVNMPSPQPVLPNRLATHGQVAAMVAILGQSISDSINLQTPM